MMVAAWLEVLAVSGVPVEHFDSCYRAARQAQVEAVAAGGETKPLSAEDLAVEWIKVRRMNDEMRREEMKHRALAEVNPKSCERCFGTGREEMPGGGVRPDCDHTPLSDEERAARDEEKREQLAWLREQAKQVGRPKPVTVEAPKPPVGVWLRCDSCPRKVNVLHYEPGQKCGDLLNRGHDEGDLKFCQGALRPSP